MIKAYPIKTIDINQATKLQFKFVDCITKHLTGSQSLSLGDLGVVQPGNMPTQTKLVENVIADFFEAQDAILVRGSGTGALRFSLFSSLKSGDKILVHDAPIYPTTKVNIDAMGLEVVYADFNDLENLESIIRLNNDLTCSLVQYTRQKIDDSYKIDEVISVIKKTNANIKVITDDNYAALKVNNIGCQLGADLSTFSTFKLLGPEGVGVIVGNKDLIDKIRKLNYSGGSQVQGYEAMEVLRGFTYAPVSLAIQSEQNNQLVERLNSKELPGVKSATIVNAQSKVTIVELEKPIAKKVIENSAKYGAAVNPVGAESKYELVPMIYRVSSTFRNSIADAEDYLIRINPMRSSADTIINILRKAMEE